MLRTVFYPKRSIILCMCILPADVSIHHMSESFQDSSTVYSAGSGNAKLHERLQLLRMETRERVAIES